MTKSASIFRPIAYGTELPTMTGSTLWRVAVIVCGMWCASSLHAQTQARYRLVGWQPAAMAVDKQDATGSTQRLQHTEQTVRADEQICLAKGNAAQTLVQVQPAEGGETRFIVLGGRLPVCQPVGAAWSSAQTKETPWYEALFAMLGVQSGGARVAASTEGGMRGKPPIDPTQPMDQDACGLYPAAQGLIQLPSGPSLLMLGTSLPDGTSLALEREGQDGGSPRTATVVKGRVTWSRAPYQTGESWRISFRHHDSTSPGTSAPTECRARIKVQPKSANPLDAVRQNSPTFAADDSTATAALVAAQLEDPNQAAWHAWLLGTIAPSQQAALDLGATMWRTWWDRNRAPTR